MEQDKSKLVGICGLYCGTCPGYLAWRRNDKDQLERRAKYEGIPVAEVRCDGCLSGRVLPSCAVCTSGFRECARNNNVTWCFECKNFPCQRLRDFRDAHIVKGISHHAQVIDDLQYMKEHGIERWVEEKEKAGRCPKCGEVVYWFSRQCHNCQAQIR